MSGGWIVEVRGRRPCQTLATTQLYAVAVEDRRDAERVVAQLAKGLRDVHVTPRTKIPDNEFEELGLSSDAGLRHLP